MSGYRIITEAVDCRYLYDGSWDGFFCCLQAAVYSRELPVDILPTAVAEPSLLPDRQIISDAGQAAKVRKAVIEKISPRAFQLVRHVFCSNQTRKELLMLNFLLLGFRVGAEAPYLLGHPDVAPLLKAEKHLMGEVHLLKGFLRFSDYDGVLAATITPKHFALPFLADHFINRFSGEDFLIYDQTHRAALLYEQGRRQYLQLEQIEFPAVTEKEENYRALWKQFYRTIAIEARYNPRCRMTQMPKRYWANMLEMQESL